MKKILLLTIVALTVGVGQLFSQSKVGHVEYEYLIYLMPEIKDVEKKVLDKQQQFQNYLQEKEKLLATLQAEIQDQTKDAPRGAAPDLLDAIASSSRRMVNPTRFRATSTSMTFTFTRSPVRTTLRGSSTNLFESAEIWTKPS